jgi:hypothetical protein
MTTGKGQSVPFYGLLSLMGTDDSQCRRGDGSKKFCLNCSEFICSNSYSGIVLVSVYLSNTATRPRLRKSQGAGEGKSPIHLENPCFFVCSGSPPPLK